jgi:hypothetical protein
MQKDQIVVAYPRTYRGVEEQARLFPYAQNRQNADRNDLPEGMHADRLALIVPIRALTVGSKRLGASYVPGALPHPLPLYLYECAARAMETVPAGLPSPQG